MKTIHCKGHHVEEFLQHDHDPSNIRATILHIHGDPKLLHSLSFLEQEAVNLTAEGFKDPENSSHEIRRERLHNQYGHLVP